MRLITLGDCLFTSITGQCTTWATDLAHELGCEHINLAVLASQNLLQIQLLQDWMLHNTLDKDDIVIWQIGFSWHPLIHVGEEYQDLVDKAEDLTNRRLRISHYHTRYNSIDNKKRYSLLHVSPIQYKFFNRKQVKDQADILQNMLFMFKMIKISCPRLLVIRGRNDFVQENFWNIAKEYMNKENIDFIDEGMINWCERNDLESFMPGHPTDEALNVYKDQIVIPKLKELNWMNVNESRLD